MECNENGRERTLSAATSGRGVKRKRRTSREVGLYLAFPPSVPDAADPLSMRVNLVPYYPPEQPFSTDAQQDHPFMNNMDEISYWIYTKRAPCLFNYDNVIKKQIEQAHCSKTKPISIHSDCEEVPSPKKKKRKLKLLDEDSVSSEKQQNIYFETSKCENQKTAPSSCKSEPSNIDFNIKSSTQPNTAKRMKVQKNCQTAPKKSKLVTSTPKVTNLRRSLRRAQQNNNNTQLNSSFEINDTSFINGKRKDEVGKDHKSDELAGDNHVNQSKTKIISDKEKNAIVLNGQFEDLSDVSGFTANYIRSTKIHSSNTPRKLRNRNNRNLIKDSKQNVTSEEKMLVCINKAVNTQLPDTTMLNCSTDSSQNIINLISIKNNEKSTRVNKSTSPLKFMDAKLDKGNASNTKNDKQGKNDLKISFQSKSSGASRYPRRQRNITIGDSEQNCSKVNSTTVNSPVTRHSARKTKVNNSDKKENSQDKIKPNTRKGRRPGLKVDMEESGCSMLQLNSSDPVSSSVALNVASPTKKGKKNNSTVRCLRSRRCRDKSGQDKDSVSDKSDKQDNAQGSVIHSTTPRCVRRVKKSLNKTGHSTRDSLRDKSGFAACFSDSDSDSEPLKQRKFFC